MSFLDSIGHFFKAVGGAASQYAGAAFDYATAPTTGKLHDAGQSVDDFLLGKDSPPNKVLGYAAHFLTNTETQANAANKVYQAVTGNSDAEPVQAHDLSWDAVMTDANQPYKQLVDRPAQTPADLFIGQLDKHESGLSAFLPDSWSDVRTAWNRSADHSLGQATNELAEHGPGGAAMSLATYGNPLSPAGLLAGGNTAITNLVSHGNKQAESIVGGFSGGAVDLVTNFALDPLNLIGLGYAAKLDKSRGVIKGAAGLRDLAKNLNGADTGTSISKNLKGMHGFLEDARNRAINVSNKTTAPVPVERQGVDGTVTQSIQAMSTADFNPMWIKNAAPEMPMPVATQLAEAMKITDSPARARAYNDIIAASAGDTTALSRLTHVSTRLGALAKRATDPNETEVLDSLGDRARFAAQSGEAIESGGRLTDQEVVGETAQALIANHMGWVAAIHGDNLDGMIGTLNKMDNTAHQLQYVPKLSTVRADRIATGRNIAPLGRHKVDPLSRNKSAAEIEAAIPGAVDTAGSAFEPGVLMLRDPNERLNKVYRAFATQVAGSSIDLKDLSRGQSQITAYLQEAHADPQMIQTILNKYVTASTSIGRRNVVGLVEDAAWHSLGKRYNLSRDDVDDIAHQVSVSRRAYTENSYTGLKDAEGKPLDRHVSLDPDGKIVAGGHEPILSTQDISVAHLANVQKVGRALSRNSATLAARRSFLHDLGVAGVKGAYGAMDVAEVAPQVMRLWKAEVLFRLGYPVRNLIDNDLSTYANVGGSVLTSVVFQRLKSIGRLTNVRVGRRIAHDETRLAALIGTNGDPDEIARLEKQLDNPRNYMRGVPKEQREGVKLPSGETTPAWDEGPEGQQLRSQLSAGIGQAMSDNMSRTFKEVMDTGGGWKTVGRDDPSHLDAWANALNKQVFQDKAAQKVLFDDMDEHQLSRWLKHDPEGKAYAKRIPTRAANPEDWAERIVKHVRGTATDDVLALMKDENAKLTPEMLKRIPKDRRPDVNGGQAMQSLGAGSAFTNMLEHINGRVMRLIGDLPDEAFGRHPLAAALYRHKFRELLDAHPNQWAEPQDIERMTRASRKFAQEKVRKAVYDTHFHSNGAKYMSIVSPFANAWQEAFRRYGIAVWNNPHRLYNLYKTYEAPAKMGAVVDENGNKIDHFNPLDPGSASLQVPMIGWKPDGSLGVVKYRINIQSFNVAIQGNPWWSPGAGPLVAMPMQELTKRFPSLEDTYEEFVSPYGPTANAADQFLSASAKRAWELFRGDKSATFHQKVIHIMQQQHAAYLDGKRKGDINPDQAIGMARKLTEFEFVASMTMPFIPKQNSEYQFYRDQWRKLSDEGREKHPDDMGWASDQFLQKYGDSFFVLTQSTSKNNAGLDPSAKAVSGFRKYQSTIKGLENPALAGSVVGPDGAGGEFNQAAYRSEYGMQITTRGGGDKTNMARSNQTIGQYEDDVQQREGWTKYNKFMTDIDAWAVDTYGKSGSYLSDPRTVLMRQQMIRSLSFNDDGTYTPFGKEWGSMDAPGAYGKYVNDFMHISSSPQLKNRADVKVLGKYVHLRQQITDVLQKRQDEGGSGNIQANTNADVRYVFTRVVNGLAHSNTTFNDNWYQKYITHDPYYDPDMIEGASDSGTEPNIG